MNRVHGFPTLVNMAIKQKVYTSLMRIAISTPVETVLHGCDQCRTSRVFKSPMAVNS